jgi:hypothetical protein
MICQRCRKDSIPDAVYCPYCGRKLSPEQKKRRPKRSPNGTGSAFKRGSGWVAQAVVGYRELPDDLMDPANKRQRVPVKKTKAGFATKAEALAYIPTLKALKPDIAPTLQYYWNNYEKNEYTALSASKQTAYSIAWNRLDKLHNVRVDQLIVQMLNAQYRQQPVDDQLVHALVPDHAAQIVIISKLVIDLPAAELRRRLQERPRRPGGVADLAPVQIRQILFFVNNPCFHLYHHLIAVYQYA